MGNDGGSIPTRRELVKTAARTPTISELKATVLENLTHAWAHDPVTSELLDMENVVSDWRGRLYSYESVLKGLMPNGDDDDSSEAPVLTNGESTAVDFASTDIKSLRDVVKLKFTRYTPPGTKGQEIWACPVSMKELGPATKAVYIVPCGHVFADAAIKQIQEDICPECSSEFKAGDVVPILPTERADLDFVTTRISSLRRDGLTHSLKKDKSNVKKKRKAGAGDWEAKNADGAPQPEKAKGSRQENGKAAKASGINNPMTASLTAKVLAEQEERNKRRKLANQAS
ncbi:replication termination factor 2 [Dichotomopilus funicola]|uniref:Replication termination factor 2 n=1 Tax=Dichotomopilus funicola TaxID=1934379 RepID=A0AAN6ZP50_9PEZI|nr:replication termination factor 2 [Dichotomopilus funicola]